MATDLNKQLVAWLAGLSKKISVLCNEVKIVRAKICVSLVHITA